MKFSTLRFVSEKNFAEILCLNEMKFTYFKRGLHEIFDPFMSKWEYTLNVVLKGMCHEILGVLFGMYG
jgi:hypothetical protein